MGNKTRFDLILIVILIAIISGVSAGCRKWTNPSSLSDNISPDGTNAINPQVAVNTAGNGIAVWEQMDGVVSQIYKSEFINGAWVKTRITDKICPTGTNAYSPKVAINDGGDAVIVWVQQYVVPITGSRYYRVYKSERKNWVWTHPLSLSDSISPEGTDAYYPRVVMNNAGDVLVAWEQSDGSRFQIFKSERRNGTWNNPGSLLVNISPDNQDAYYPVPAIDGEGDAIVVWEQFDGANWQIFKSEKRSGMWDNPSSLRDNISPDSRDAYYPQVAMSDSKEAVIAWEQNDGFRYQIFCSVFTADAWDNPTGLDDNISPDEGNAYYPQVALNDSGKAVIAWEQELASGEVRIYKSELNSKIWTNPRNIDDSLSLASTSAWLPQVAMDSKGNAIITWFQYDSDGKYQIFKSEYSMTARLDAPFMQWSIPKSLSDNISPDGQDARNPQVAMSDSGNAVIVWQQLDGSFSQIFKSEFLTTAVATE